MRLSSDMKGLMHGVAWRVEACFLPGQFRYLPFLRVTVRITATVHVHVLHCAEIMPLELNGWCTAAMQQLYRIRGSAKLTRIFGHCSETGMQMTALITMFGAPGKFGMFCFMWVFNGKCSARGAVCKLRKAGGEPVCLHSMLFARFAGLLAVALFQQYMCCFCTAQINGM